MGQQVTTRELMYIIEELSSRFISRDALVNLGSKLTSNISLGWVASGCWIGSGKIESVVLNQTGWPERVSDCSCGCSFSNIY
jgi:hypothetical protein